MISERNHQRSSVKNANDYSFYGSLKGGQISKVVIKVIGHDQTDWMPYLVSIFYLEIPWLAKITPSAHDYITLFHQVV